MGFENWATIWLNIGAIITLGSVATYYYGKLLVDMKPQQENKFDVYVRGFFFLIGYLIFPFAIVYYIVDTFPIFTNLFSPSIFTLGYIVLLFLILGVIGRFVASEYTRRFELSQKIDFKDPELQQKIYDKENVRKLKGALLFWCGTLLYVLPIASIIVSHNLRIFSLLFLFIFVSLLLVYTSLGALLRGMFDAYYFPIKVVLNSGEEIEGLLWEFKDPIVIWKIERLGDGRELRVKYNIPRSSVKYTVNENVVKLGTSHIRKSKNQEAHENGGMGRV